MAAEMFAEGQAARRVPSDDDAATVRADLRSLAKDAGVRIRTARMESTVVIARLDAAIWQDDAATMRRKLPPTRGLTRPRAPHAPHARGVLTSDGSG
jgi:hypothetical protein